ncbi:hypothetical protein CCHR01_09889 [Colletotrichum chrysophilum]|uniref:Uncharacterized protein n=1 Tax=Colletotrichum chrysophilum TaxID=1836956 RepID=A0AAD9EGE4_9PEZI|nr:hypothetical protein CCHR01_09889 [Colletotrichum chrysophilum]
MHKALSPSTVLSRTIDQSHAPHVGVLRLDIPSIGTNQFNIRDSAAGVVASPQSRTTIQVHLRDRIMVST